MPQKIALLGGTFDPVHIGHLCIAEWVQQSLGLDQMLFVPAAVPPHKYHAITPALHRVRMLELAMHEDPRFDVSTIELSRSGPSYTLHTLQHMARELEDAEIWWVVGLDSLMSLHTWYHYEQFPKYARLAVLPRPGQKITDADQLEDYVAEHLPMYVGHVDWIDMPLLEISSSSIRTWLHEGRSCRFLLPPAVWEYIQHQGLYKRREF